ncbi:PASTA domain-containing protein [Solirubrobacter taibaiensis]|nr:PASTA domain-containing protein [Solirubrobacter taibaiensis]
MLTSHPCPNCGHSNTREGDFCRSCGEYLCWEPTQEHVGPADAAPPTQPSDVPATVPPAPEPGAGTAAAVLLVMDPDPTAVQPPQAVGVGGLLRNQSGRVDTYDVRVTGVPTTWVTVTPETLFLMPFGTARDMRHEDRFQITFAPPRSPETRAGTYSCVVEVVSRSDQAVVARAPLALEVLPFHELTVAVAPLRRRGRRRARFDAAITNAGNIATYVRVRGGDEADACDVAFDDDGFSIDAGATRSVQALAVPRRPLLWGQPAEHRLELRAASDQAAPPAQNVIFVQRPWIAVWMPAAAATLAAVLALLLLLRPEQVTMPDVLGYTQADAQAQMVRAGVKRAPQVATRIAPAKLRGRIIEQTPDPRTNMRADDAVQLVIGVGRTTVKVPALDGLTLAQAQARLERAKLTLGAVTPDDAAANATVHRQNPSSGRRLRIGSPVNLHAVSPEEPEVGGEPTADDPAAGDEPGGGEPTDAVRGLRTLVAEDERGILIDPPGRGDAFRPGSQAGDTDPVWVGDKVVFRRGASSTGDLYMVDATKDATPEPLTTGGEWSAPAVSADGRLAAIRANRLCVGSAPFTPDHLPCLPAEPQRPYRTAWAPDRNTLYVLVDAKTHRAVLRYDVQGEASLGPAQELATFSRAADLAVSPDGRLAVVGRDDAYDTAVFLVDPDTGGATAVDGIDQACSLSWLDADRLAVGAGRCGDVPELVLVDIRSGEHTPLDNRAVHFAFQSEDEQDG